MKITDSAINKIYELISEENNFNLCLRIYIEGGGCSGFQYGFAFTEEITTDDFIFDGKFEDKKVQVLIDSMSYQYLNEAELDYEKSLQGEQFIIRNPSVKTTCGCGSSFSID